MFNWNKKEKPLQGLMGVGGGATGYLVRGGGSVINTSNGDPFGDGSCLYTYRLEGNADSAVAGGAVSVSALTIDGGGNPFTSNGKFGNAYSGNGSDRLTGNDSNHSPGGDFSVNFWYKSNTQNQSNTRVLTLKGATCTAGWSNYNGSLGFYVGTGNLTTSVTRVREISDATVNNNVWHQLTFSVQGNGTHSVWFDGSPWTSTVSGEGRSFSINDRLCITTYDGSTGYNTICDMDQIRVFNKVLTNAEVSALYSEIT